MRNFIFASVVAAVTAMSADARAELIGVYFQGFGGVAGGESEELMPGGDPPGLGPAYGFQAGAHLLMFDGYYDRTAFSRGSVSRLVIGLRGSSEYWRIRLTARAGVGALWEEEAVLGEAMTLEPRSGAVARAGAALDYRLTPAIFLGFAFDAEAFAISPAEATFDDIHLGTDVMGTFHAGFQLGI